MDTDLELAIKAIDEIQDIRHWESELTRAITEFSLQSKFGCDNTNLYLYGDELLEFVKNSQKLVQDVCIKKMKEYKITIIEQQDLIKTNQLEIEGLQAENNQLKEMNATYNNRIDELAEYLNEADKTNTGLQKENTCLRHELARLETLMTNIEGKSHQKMDKIIQENKRKHVNEVDELNDRIMHQNSIINKLQKDLEEYELVKKKSEYLERENAKIGLLNKEIARMQLTISELNENYQDLISRFSQRVCSCTPTNARNKECGEIINTKIIQESEDEDALNKNKESKFAGIVRRNSHHNKIASLVDEITFTKIAANAALHNHSSGHLKKLSKELKSHKNLKSAHMFYKSAKKNLLSEVPNQTGWLEQQDHSRSNSSSSIIEFRNDKNYGVKGKELITSELGSDAEDENDGVGPEMGEEEGGDVFQKEKILLSWSENDFPRLTSKTSFQSMTKDPSQDLIGFNHINTFSENRKSVRKSEQLVYSRGKEQNLHGNKGVTQKSSKSECFDSNAVKINVESCRRTKTRSENVTTHLLKQKLQVLKDKETENDLNVNNIPGFNHLEHLNIEQVINEQLPEETSKYQEDLTNDHCPKPFINIDSEDLQASENANPKLKKEVGTDCLHKLNEESEWSTMLDSKVDVKQSPFSMVYMKQSSFLTASGILGEKSTQTSPTFALEREEEEEIEETGNLLSSVALTALPIVASASITYLLLRKKLML